MRPPWSRLDWVLGGLLAFLGLASRAVLRADGLTTLDSGLLATAVVDYDFANVRPHAPYYPLTIAMARVVAPFVGPFDAISWLSVLSTAVLAAATFAVARHFLGRVASAGAGLLVLASPLALASGTAPLSYALEGASSAVLALAALQARRRPGPARWLALGLLASVAVGIRPSSLFLLAPVVAWGAGMPGRAWAWTGGSAAAATLAWGIPAILAGGGLDPFLFGLSAQSRVFILANPVWVGGWPAVQDNTLHLLAYVRFEAAFLLAVAVVGTVAATAAAPNLRRSDALPLLASWALPALAFYTFIYAGWPVFPDGYLMALVPAAAFACALLLDAIARAVLDPLVPKVTQAGGAVAVAAVCVLPLLWLGAWDDALAPQHDAQAWGASWDGMEAALPANETAILVFYGSPWIMLQHPDYLAWNVQPIRPVDGPDYVQVFPSRGLVFDKSILDDIRDGPDAPHPIPAGIRQVVLFQGHPMDGGVRLVREGVPTTAVTLPSGAVAQVVATAGFTNVEDLLPQP